MQMEIFADMVKKWLETRSVHLYVIGDQGMGKSCFILSLFEKLYLRRQFEFDFCPSLLRALYTRSDLLGLLIDESGYSFDARSWQKSIAQVFEWTRIFRRIIGLCTPHEENQDVIIRDRSSFIEIEMIRSRVGIVEGVGVVTADQVSDSLLVEFQKYEYEKKRELTKKLVEGYITKYKVIPKV